jgi:TPP-dependent pyruvate/acetoin dehydrogenase alpha subunit
MRFRQQTIDHRIFTASELDEIDARNKALLDEAVKFADESPLPDAAELMTDVYSSE